MFREAQLNQNKIRSDLTNQAVQCATLRRSLGGGGEVRKDASEKDCLKKVSVS